MSSVPRGTCTLSMSATAFASRWAKTTPRVRIPTRARWSALLLRSSNSCAMRTSALRMASASMTCAFSFIGEVTTRSRPHDVRSLPLASPPRLSLRRAMLRRALSARCRQTLCARASDARAQVGWERSLKLQGATGGGMGKLQAKRVQRLPPDAKVIYPAVDRIARHGVPQVGEMHPDLVRASSHQLDRSEEHTSELQSP